MVKIQINLTHQLNKKVELHKVVYDLKTKEEAVLDIIKRGKK